MRPKALKTTFKKDTCSRDAPETCGRYKKSDVFYVFFTKQPTALIAFLPRKFGKRATGSRNYLGEVEQTSTIFHLFHQRLPLAAVLACYYVMRTHLLQTKALPSVLDISGRLITHIAARTSSVFNRRLISQQLHMMRSTFEKRNKKLKTNILRTYTLSEHKLACIL